MSEREKTEYEIMQETGNWRDDCWILRPKYFESFGFAKAFGRDVPALERSLDELAKLYPPEYCKRVLKDRTFPHDILELFFPGMGVHVWNALYLATDLLAIPGWQRDTGLVAGLRARDGYHDRRVEVGVWASLNRSGLLVERVKEGKRKANDFNVRVGADVFRIEVKALWRSREDLAIEEINQDFFHAFFPMWRGSLEEADLNGYEVEYSPTTSLRDRIKHHHSLEDAKRAILRGIPEMALAVRAELATREPPFAIPFGGLGSVEVRRSSEPDSGSAGSNLEESRPEHQVSRALRTLEKAAGQLPGLARSIIVLHASRYVVPAEWLHREIRRLVELREERFRHVDGIVVTNHYRRHDELDVAHVLAQYVPPWSRLRTIPDELIKGLVQWRWYR